MVILGKEMKTEKKWTWTPSIGSLRHLGSHDFEANQSYRVKFYSCCSMQYNGAWCLDNLDKLPNTHTHRVATGRTLQTQWQKRCTDLQS